MSDFYDSLEDEGEEEEKCSFDFLYDNNENSIKPRNKIENNGKWYCENENLNKKNTNKFVKVQCNKTAESNICKDSNFLPEIHKNASNGGKSGLLCTVIDPEVLSKQGLQLNNDGGIIKSPESNIDELPFVTREYRNFQFQKKKICEIKKKERCTKFSKANVFTFEENPKNGISMCAIISARKNKGSSEELLVSGGSSSSVREDISAMSKKFGNMTDSMKEILMQKFNERNAVKTSLKTREKLFRKKSALDLLEACKPTDRSFAPVKGQQWRKSQTKCLLPCIGVEQKRTHSDTLQKKCDFVTLPKGEKLKSTKGNVLRHRSDILIKSAKPNLSYAELRQKESGFNPLCLRFSGKKTSSETSRSNFGDSVPEKLSEISDRVFVDHEIADDEDEESFYRNFIAKEKSKMLAVRCETMSDTSKKSRKRDISKEYNSGKISNELLSGGAINTKVKRLLKSASIDFPAVVNCPEKKNSHYCTTNPSPCMSKAELAMKAKAYGFLANARNIFKMKTQSDGKLAESKKENSSKILPKENANSVIVLNNNNNKILKNKSVSLRTDEPETCVRTSTSLCRTKKYQVVKQK